MSDLQDPLQALTGARRRIAIFNANATHRDPRVLRIGGMLAAAGHEVVVFEMRLEGQAERETLRGMEIRRVRVPLTYADDDMQAIERALPEAGEAIRIAHPLVWSFPEARGLQNRTLARRVVQRLARTVLRRRAPITGLYHAILPMRSIMLFDLALYEAARAFAPEIVHCNDLDTLLAGFMLKRTVGSTLVFDAHELYPEQFAADQRTDHWHSFYTNLERILVQHSDARLTVCDSIADYFGSQYQAPGFVTVRNVPSIRQIAPDSVLERRRERPLILYHGAYFPHRGLDEIIAAARSVDGARFVFRGIGDHRAVLERLVAAHGLGDRVTFAPPVAVEELVASATECDIGLSPFIPVCNNTEFALPNKFFEYLMAGLACVSSDLVEMRRLTERHALGVLLRDLSPAAIARTLNELLARPDDIARYRANALALARNELNWEAESRKLAGFYRPLLANR